MQIQLVKNKDNLDEWMLIELQGTIELAPGTRSLEGQPFGPLEWTTSANGGDGGGDWNGTSTTNKNNKITLTLGHQLLEGRLEELVKPYLVLNRDSVLINGQQQKKHDDEEIPTKQKCDVVAIVRKKLVFSERPKPIIKHC